MKSITAIRFGVAAFAIALAACSNPSDKSANSGVTGGATAGTAAGSIDVTTATTPGTGSDTTHAANDSAKKTATSGNPTGASSTRPTKP